MLALTRKTDYALIALAYLAQGASTPASARVIADRYPLPLPLLMNILKTLAQGELVVSERGSRGGYRLARAAEEITLADVVECVEGPIRLVDCAGDEDDAEHCGMLCDCPVSLTLRNVHERILQLLGSISLADVVRTQGACPAGARMSHAELATVPLASFWPREATSLAPLELSNAERRPGHVAAGPGRVDADLQEVR